MDTQRRLIKPRNSSQASWQTKCLELPQLEYLETSGHFTALMEMSENESGHKLVTEMPGENIVGKIVYYC